MANITNPYGYATDVMVPSALPIEMDYRLPASLPAARNYEIRVQPVNSQSFIPGSTIQIDTIREHLSDNSDLIHLLQKEKEKEELLYNNI